jgi:hypothetical protein
MKHLRNSSRSPRWCRLPRWPPTPSAALRQEQVHAGHGAVQVQRDLQCRAAGARRRSRSGPHLLQRTGIPPAGLRPPHPGRGELETRRCGTGTTLFESKADAPRTNFDFKVATTQQLKVHIDVPQAGAAAMTCSPWAAWPSWWAIRSRHICRSEGINFPAGAAALQIPDS